MAAPATPAVVSRGALGRALLAAGALAAAAAGQWLLDTRQNEALAVALLLAGAGLGVVACRGLPLAVVSSAPATALAGPLASGRRWERVYLVLAAVLAAAAFPQFSGNRFRAVPTALWLGALAVLALYALRPYGGPRGLLRRLAGGGRGGLRLSGAALALGGIGVLAAFLRLYRIGEVPQEMGCDLPHVYGNVRQVLDGDWPIFFPSHPGREGLFFYLTAPLAALGGLSHVTIKVSSALVGLATLPALYLLGRELYGRAVGLTAAFLLAVSHWHIIISRNGLRAITAPLALCFVWLWLARGLRLARQRGPFAARGAFFLCGLALGVGMYSYNAFMVVPGLVLVMLLGEALLGRRQALRDNAANLALLALAAAIVCVPLARYAYEEPRMYAFRAATRLTSLERPLPADLLGTLVGNVWRALRMFNYQGDGVSVANVPFLRQLGFGSALLFVLGVGLVAGRVREGANRSVLLSLGVMLLPTILSLAFPDEVPNAYRAVGALPAAMLLAAVGAVGLGRAAWEGAGRSGTWPARAASWVVAAVLVVGLGREARGAYDTYFGNYVDHLPARNYSISLEMARAIDAYADGPAFIVSQPHWYDGNAVRAQLRRAEPQALRECQALVPGDAPLDGAGTPALVIVHPRDEASLEALRTAYPRGVAVCHRDYDGQAAFLAFYGAP